MAGALGREGVRAKVSNPLNVKERCARDPLVSCGCLARELTCLRIAPSYSESSPSAGVWMLVPTGKGD